ncbi:MAG: acetolactate decarboxylase [Methanoregula sp.]|jgi:acetolactate decarboxylase
MDKRNFFLGIGLAIVLVFFFAALYTGLSRTADTSADRENLYQVSTIDALMQGVYDGVQPVSELKKHGDFGIGTFDSLDGEMIALDGKYYHARSDGTVVPAQDTQTTPFATVTYFDRDFSEPTSHTLNLSEFSSEMSEKLPTRNMIYAIRIDGTFPSVKVRAIPPQQKPYPSLSDAAKNQLVYTYKNATGTVVGFYTPDFVKGLNVVGYHLHFISDDRKTGGHILDFVVPAGTSVTYDATAGFTMALPTRGDFTGVDLSGDLSGELAKVEQ